MKIKFKPSNSNFQKEVNLKVSTILTDQVLEKSKRILRAKFFFYFFMFIGLYSMLFTNLISKNFLLVILTYTLLGLSGILLAFNASHDAVHDSLFTNKKLNAITHFKYLKNLGNKKAHNK